MKILILAAIFSLTSTAYADYISQTRVLNGQTWTLETTSSRSATCAARVDTQVDDLSPGYFIFYNLGSETERHEYWAMGEEDVVDSKQVWIGSFGDEQISLAVYADEFPAKRLLSTKSFQVIADPGTNLTVLHTQQADANGRVAESCDYAKF